MNGDHSKYFLSLYGFVLILYPSMKKVTILLLFFLSSHVYPQDKNDSLLNLLESVTEADRIEVLKDLCWENRYNNPADALKYGLEALSLVKQYESYEYEAIINNYLGIIQRNVGDHATALEYFFNARRIAEEHQHAEDLAYAYNNIGDIYNLERKYRQALQYETRALKTFEELGDSSGVSYCCHQIALVYTNLGEYTSALEYDRRAMNIRTLFGNRAGVAYSLISISQTHLRLGNHDEALDCLMESSQIFAEVGDDFGLSFSLHTIGLYYKMIRQTDEAIEYFTKALELGKKSGSQIRIRNAAQELSDIYADQFRFKEAYQMHILFKETYDSLYNEENIIKITQLVMQNEYEQRELLQLAEIDKQKQVRNYLFLLIGLVIILVGFILHRYYTNRKSNIHLQQLNEDLEIQKTELNNTLEHLTHAQMQLVQSEKMASLGQVTAGVAHELNNPLNFISTSVKPMQRNMEDLIALLEKYDSLIVEKKLSTEFGEIEAYKQTLDYSYLLKETKDLLSGISEGASRSEHIVKDLRTFSRLDENEFKGVNIHEGIDSTLLLLSNKLKDRINVHKDYGSFPLVVCLPGKLNQVFMNILTNGILAIEGKGDIYIKTEGLDAQAKIYIKDTGKGMSQEIIEHIFEPFFTTRAVGKGTGLGLSITYSIIEEHCGTIEVSSTPGEGSEFIISLPFERDE